MFSSKIGIINIPKFTKSLWKNQIAINSFVRQASSGQSADQLKEFQDDTAEYLGEAKTSAAMVAYLKRAQAHAEFIEKHSHEFQVGRRHLANMMGRDPETFTQEDIDESIEYLFPSGLFEPSARPIMKPPEKIFAAKKEAEFDESGKPFHWLFYTTYPNFFELLHNVVGKMKELDRFEDEQIRKGLTPPENSAVSMGGMEWLPKNILDQKLLEDIPEDAYKQFVALMDRFIQHPYAYLAADIYEPVRKSLLDKTRQLVELEPQFTEDGRAYVTTTDNTKRPAVAKVTVYNPGSGKFTINGKDLLYFNDVQSREQVLFPLLMSKMLNKVDIEAEVWGSIGQSKQVIAVRYGIARGLSHFVDEETKENMKIAGLLTKDPRKKERKKPGQEGARRKFTWKKR